MITAAELDAAFQNVIDEVQTDQFLPGQVSEFLTQAQELLFHHFLSPDTLTNGQPTPSHFESSEKVSHYLRPFMIELAYPAVAPSPSFRIQNEVYLQSLVPAREIVALVDPKVVDSVGEEYSIKYKRHSHLMRTIRYPLLAPSECNPVYTVSAISFDEAVTPARREAYRIYPKNTYTRFVSQVLLWPVPIDIAQGIGSDFPRQLKNAIVYKSCEMAARSIREFDFMNSIAQEYKKLGL